MNFLDRGLKLLENGYRIIPIPRGHKRAVEDGWENFNATERDIRRWAAGRYRNGNIGILCEETPTVDLDIYDATMAEAMEAWVLREFGETCVRVGQAPKRLLVFRTDRPFRKMSCVYNDGKRDHGVEILGHGQQFVAYGIHPDTGQDYTWTSLDEPLTCPVSSLPTLSPEEADIILDKFEAMAKVRGWTRKRRSGARELLDDTDAFERYKPVLVLTEEKVLDTLDYLPNEDADYDTYLTVGMALHHQFKGEEAGLKLWHEWASKSTKYEPTDLNRRWSSMGHGPDTATFATLIYKANEQKRHEEEKTFEVALRRVDGCPDSKLLFGDVLKGLAKVITTDLQNDIACKRLQDRAKELTEVRPRLEVVRKMINAAKPKAEMTVLDLPKWCEGWVFVSRYGAFFNTENGQELNRANFDMAFGRYLLDDAKRQEGEASASKASDVALNLFQIPQVYDYLYMPGESRFIHVGRNLCVNTFDESSMPIAKQPTTPDDYLAIRTVEKHFEILFPDARERALLLDYLAYNVQFLSEKITWGILIQGVDGAGKTWMSDLMASIIGGENVRSVSGSSLKEQFTSWAEGKKMVFIEEVRLHDTNRFDILDKMKEYVTNRTVPIRRMQKDAYNIPNITNYVMFTNYPDALPINNNDRRYYILRTSFQTKSHIDSFRAANPDYFTDLYNAITFNADVIRHWFLTRHLSDEFQAKGHAPHTDAKDEMRDASEAGDDLETLESSINNGDPELSDLLLNTKKLRESTFLGSLPSRTFGALLSRAGFALIGKFRLGGLGSENLNFYTRHSEAFSGHKHEHLAKIRLMLDFDDGFGD